MGFRFRKSIKIAKGVRLNVGSKSMGISAGVKGARVSVNSRTGARATISAPGTGLSYSTSLNGPKRRSNALATQHQAGSASHPEFANHAENYANITVSARTILWPCLCACCGENFGEMIGSEMVAQNVYAVKMDVTTFTPFYCDHCRSHQAVWNQAEAIPPVVIPTTTLSLPMFYGLGCLMLPCLFGITESVFNMMMNNHSYASMAAIVALVLGFAAGHQNLNIDTAKKADAARIESARIERHREELELKAEQMLKPQCTSITPSVWISESYGARHTFSFVSESLANAFARINAKKVVY